MLKLAGDVKNKKVADLGAGDGRISIAFAKARAEVDAYELDENLIATLRRQVEIEKLADSVSVRQENLWNADFSIYDVLCIYPMPDIMETLEEKLKKEAKHGAKIITNYYPFSNLKHRGLENKIYLYQI